MCVTSGPAKISGTQTYVYAAPVEDSEPQRHVCGYQNVAETMSGPNCMFLNFAGSDLKLVNGPEHTRSFMDDMTSGLPELIYIPKTRGGGMYGSKGIMVVEYGDYDVIVAQGPGNILDALNEVRPDRRPRRTANLEAMVDFYMSYYSSDSFVLGCFNGNVKPKHPITVSYRPRNADVLTIPGLDGHDGRLPIIGAPVYRDFRVAFGMAGVSLPKSVRYRDTVDKSWAPQAVTGFIDNRLNGPNGDYVMPVEAVRAGLMGKELADQLVSNI